MGLPVTLVSVKGQDKLLKRQTREKGGRPIWGLLWLGMHCVISKNFFELGFTSSLTFQSISFLKKSRRCFFFFFFSRTFSEKYLKFVNGDSIECQSCKSKLNLDNLSAKRFILDLEKSFKDVSYCLAYVNPTVLFLVHFCVHVILQHSFPYSSAFFCYTFQRYSPRWDHGSAATGECSPDLSNPLPPGGRDHATIARGGEEGGYVHVGGGGRCICKDRSENGKESR